MKRILLLIMLVVILASCKKDTGCYTCTLVTPATQHTEQIKWCGDPQNQFHDEQGNAINSYCK